METLKATPGPWRVVYEPRGVVGMVDVVGSRLRVRGFTIAADVTEAQGRQTMADAHLIAAAPALYEAGERLANVADDKLATIRETVEAINAMRAALALARGEHPTPPSRVGLDPDAGTRQHGEK